MTSTDAAPPLPTAASAAPSASEWGARGTSTAVTVASGATLVAVWYIGAWALPASILPPPHVVLATLVQEMIAGGIWGDIGITLSRIAAAFAVAMGISMVLGFAMGLSPLASEFFRVWVVCFITIPALVVILTCYMMAGLNDTAAILGSAIPVIPILTINIREGVKNIDPHLLGMARAFRASRRQQIRSVIIPQVAPMLLASTRFGLGLVWKMVIFAELLGRGDGIGYKIEFYYQMFNMTEVLAQALSFLFVMLLIEVLILGTLERRIFRWRER